MFCLLKVNYLDISGRPLSVVRYRKSKFNVISISNPEIIPCTYHHKFCKFLPFLLNHIYAAGCLCWNCKNYFTWNKCFWLICENKCFQKSLRDSKKFMRKVSVWVLKVTVHEDQILRYLSIVFFFGKNIYLWTHAVIALLNKNIKINQSITFFLWCFTAILRNIYIFIAPSQQGRLILRG